jgi:hypothetical protein
MTDHEAPDRTIHVKDEADIDHGTDDHDAVREGTEEADRDDPSIGGSSDGDTAS